MAVLAGTAMSQPAFQSPLTLPSAPSALAGRAPVNALAMAGTRLVSAGQRGHILFSDDEGKTWTQAAVPVSSDLTAIFFVDARQGWAAGHEGVILHSADGGATWQLQLDGQRAAQLVVHQYGQPSQPADASAERLARDAATFAAQGADKPFLDIYFENEREGFAIGAFNLILRTEDGGQRWTPWLDRVDNPDALHLYAMRPAAGTLFMVGEQGLTLKLDRERGRFVRVPLPYKGTLFGVLGTPQMVMVFGLRGNAWRSTDGGASWTRTNTGVNAGLAGGTARSDGSILLASQAGQLLRSTDDGASFDRVALGRVAPVFALAASTTQAVALGGPDGVRMEWLKNKEASRAQ
ncbi:YCF48-related protein [Variovorax sp. YR216]|uniref:WD40/YVTN/BNR-like repeat-containing protein n=1 Tax=Variovorax sp. YR216 TaxID=1882828 RepID=UPI001C40AD40|nr:YCF48-related protein [Variovorax sp. YR216]